MARPNPARDLWVAQCAHPGDAAFDAAHPDFRAALDRYLADRDPAALAAVPRVAGAGLTLWRLKPLTDAQLADVNAGVGASVRQYFAFVRAVVERLDGAQLAPDGTPEGGQSSTPDDRKPLGEWVAAQTALGGGMLVAELGQLAIDRATVHPRDTDPFFLPSPLARAR